MSNELVKETNIITVPHSLEELWGYFRLREEQDSSFQGYADIAADAADAIQLVRSRRKTEEPIMINIALVPGRSAGIYTREFTKASRELQELLLANMITKADETSETNFTGRIWWQSLDAVEPVNLIETRSIDDRGCYIRFTAVTDVPADLTDHHDNQPFYSEEAEKAIQEARALQKVASRAISYARDQELDFYKYVKGLPETQFNSPYDIAA